MFYEFLRWFSGGENQYMTYWHCMNHDTFWTAANCMLAVFVIIGYLIIAGHWYKNFRNLEKGLARTSLFNMVNIFLFCGICGYLFIPLKIWWPAWRLHAIFLVFLNFFTWRYALNTPKLRVIYEQIHKSGELVSQLEAQKQEKGEIIRQLSEIQRPIEEISERVFFGIDENTNPKTIEKVMEIRKKILEATHQITVLLDKIEDSKP